MIAAGDRLRDLREDKGKTQAEISSLLGTTQQIYSRYETNLLPEESARNGETIS